MGKLYQPAGYQPAIGIKEIPIAIKSVKEYFERQLAKQLNLTRVSAPAGGGISQSRMCKFSLRKAQIGEVQSSNWDEDISLEA